MNVILTAITESLAAYVERGDWREAMGRLLRCALSETHSEYGFIGVVVDCSSLRVLAHEGIVWDQVINRAFYEEALRTYDRVGYLEFTNFNNLFGRAITTGKVVIANAPDADPRSGGRPQGHPPMHSFLGVPIFAGAQVQGLVALANRPGGYTEAEQNHIEMLVRHAGGLCSSYRQHESALVLARERAAAESGRRESEERLRLAVQAAQIGLWDWTLATNQVVYSSEWKRQLGYASDEITNGFEEWESRVHPDDLPRTLTAVERYLERPDGSYEQEFRMRHKDGSWRWIYARGEVLRDADGKPHRLLGCHVDITERKRAEESLHENEQRLRSLLDTMFVYVCLLTSDGRIVEVNRAALKASDRTRDEVIGTPLASTEWFAHSPAAQHQLRRALRRAAQGEVVREDFPVKLGAGRIATLDTTFAPLRDTAGRVVQLVGSAVDITARQLTQAALRESVERFKAVVRATSDVVWDWNLETGIIVWNEGFQTVFGYPPQEIQPDIESWTSRLHPDDRERVVAGAHLVLEGTGHAWSDEYRFRRHDGSYADVFDRGFVVRDDKGRAIRVTGAMQDTTERKRAEQQIRKLAAFPELNPNPVLEFDAGGRLTYSNPASQALVHAVGSPDLATLLPADTGEIVRHCLTLGQALLRRETQYGNHTISWSYYPMTSQQIVHCYAGDITERRLLEEQLRQSQKMDAIGHLAGGVAHDFNNLLTVIQGNTTMLQNRLLAEDEWPKAIEEIAQACDRAAALTRQLLAFSRRQVLQPRQVDLNEIVTGITRLLQRILGEDIRVQLNLHPRPVLTRADAGMLDQVIINLAVNARDAMPDGGQLVIETTVLDLGEPDLRRFPDAALGRHACLRVSDTGSGIAPEILPRIFEPFFTTKEPGKGTGLGLATVYGIVKQHAGSLRVESVVGRGATFELVLPADDTRLHRHAAPPPDDQPRQGAETILVVEDEDPVRRLIRRVLESNGYRVLLAGTGAEALQMWEQAADEVNLVLTDIIMPGGISGRDLGERLRARKPGLRVVYMSGYTGDVAGRGLNLREGVNFLPKPFVPAALLDCVRTSLDMA